MITATDRSIQQEPPGPNPLPIVGSIFRLNPKQNILFNFIDLWQEFGDLCHVKLGPLHLYIVVKPEHVHHVLVRNPDNYIKGNGYNGFRLLVGQGLVTSDGDLWRQQRRLIQPSFTPRSTAHFVDLMVAAIQATIKRWQATVATGQPLHIDDEMARLTMSIISQTIFGVDLGAESGAVSQAFHEAFAFVTARTMSAFALPLTWPLPQHRHFQYNRRIIDEFVQTQISKGRQSSRQDSLLALLLQATDEETGERMSDEQVRDEVVTMFLAGFETTARSLTWGWYLLDQHPAVVQRLEAEVDAAIGTRSPTLADLAALPYTRMVVDEILRHYPPAGMLARQVVADDQIDGYHIRGNGIVMLLPFMTHRYPGVWPDPEAFIPERFHPDQVGSRPKSAYIPFSGGARICLGNHFALTEMVFTFAMIMARYRLQRSSTDPIGYGFHGSICPTAPLWMTLDYATSRLHDSGLYFMTSTTASTTSGVSVSPANPQRDYQIAWVATFLFFIAFYALIIPLPRYLTEIGLPDWQVGLVLGATAIASLIARPISGVLTDRFGHKRMLLIGAIALTVGAIGVVLTGQVAVLFVLRILQSLGYVIFTTAGTALVGQLATPEERSKKIAYFGLAANFAMTMTPGAMDTLLPWIGLLSAFWLSGGMAAGAGLMTRALRYDARSENMTAQPLALGEFWRFPRQLWLSMGVSVLFGAGFGAYFQYFAVLLERRSIPAPAVFATYGLSIIATRLLFGRYLDRIGFARVLSASALLMTAGLVVAAYGLSLSMLILAAALIATGGGFFHPMLIAHHVTMLPSRPGWAVACFYFGFDLGIGGGAWILGAVLDWSGLTALYLTAAFLTLATLFFIPALARQQRNNSVKIGD